MKNQTKHCLVYLLLISVVVLPFASTPIVASQTTKTSVKTQKVATLPRSTPEQQGISSAEILAFIEAADKDVDTMKSFMLIRHRHVLAEGWCAP